MPFPAPENLFIHCGVGGATGSGFSPTTGGGGGGGCSTGAFDLLTSAFQSFFGFVALSGLVVILSDLVAVLVVVVVDNDDPADIDGNDGIMGAPAPTGPL